MFWSAADKLYPPTLKFPEPLNDAKAGVILKLAVRPEPSSIETAFPVIVTLFNNVTSLLSFAKYLAVTTYCGVAL